MRCCAAALVLGALLACAVHAAAPYRCALDAAPPARGSCARFRYRHRKRHNELGVRCVSVEGEPRNVTLYWGSPPARAAAALARVQLRHVLRYSGVHVEWAPHRTKDLVRSNLLKHDPAANYKNLAVGVSTAWTPETPPRWVPDGGLESGLAGPRLSEFGASSVPARCGLHARWAPDKHELHNCTRHTRHTRWAFYTDARAVELCGFVVLFQGNVSAVELLVVEDCNATLLELRARTDDAAAVALRLRTVKRYDLINTMRTANHSFIFLDYEIWEGALHVSTVEPPPCASVNSSCQQQLDSAIAIRVADVNLLRTYGPQLFRFIHDYKPTLLSLRTILELESNGTDIDEAACKWALSTKSNNTAIWYYDLTEYSVTVFLCDDDPDIDLYLEILRTLGPHINNETSTSRFYIRLVYYNINCSDSYHMSVKLEKYTNYANIFNLLGVLSQSVEGVSAASAIASANYVPMLLIDAVPHDAAADATWSVAGRPRHVARALQHFMLQAGWARLAVLSQPTTIAKHYYAVLQDDAKFALRQFRIPLTLTELQAEEVLQHLHDTNARIVFVNADTKAAAMMLSAARKRHMTYTDGFVWIVRDWRANNATVTSHTTHFTVSLWSRGIKDTPPVPGSRAKKIHVDLNTMLLNRTWPSHAASLADALLTLVYGFKHVFHQYPDTRQDLHSAHAMRALNESLIDTPVIGLSQVLHYKERSVEEVIVYVDEWRGGELELRLASWRVNATSGRVRGASSDRAELSPRAPLPRDDVAAACLARVGDAFDPTCYDAAWACALLLLALAPAALLLTRRHLARLRQQRELDRIARHRHVASALSAWLVERDALELQRELGAGRFGSVRLALLRAPGRTPRYIAAKALRDNAAPTEESEFLREACTIASLDHEHIVRLVGVCIKDGPPLVLMELAFFGDLLGYLRARHHLAEGSVSEELAASEEAVHVSAEALTRLAREAAEALEYLSSRGLVHRDVRAANCLVDARRSLKLADFGMARETVAGADGALEYSCRRRGLFPVLWMAPESLAHGVFSSASDVWALGVLVLELVTLGARPYGSMSPLRVLEYVRAGGRPPLPLDATPQTRGLARWCWQREAERRPSAAEVVALLTTQPRTLRPALLSGHEEPADADSGFEESPSAELLPPDFPLHSFDH